MPSTVAIFFSAGASAAITKEGVKKPTRQMAARAKLNLLIHKRRCMDGLLKAIEITLRLITNRRFGDAGQVLSGKRLDLAGGKGVFIRNNNDVDPLVNVAMVSQQAVLRLDLVFQRFPGLSRNE